MESLILIGVILGIAAGVFATSYFYKSKNERQINDQSILLLDKIKHVSKLITVEGEFAEIFTHRDAKKYLFNLFQMKNKALIIVKAKVMVGFDLTKININITKEKKQVTLSNFPEPEILSIETDLEFYDFQKGIINKFTEVDMTSVNKKAKDFIREKAKDSHLITIAKNQSLDTISIIRQLIESVGWELVPEKKLESSLKNKEIPD